MQFEDIDKLIKKGLHEAEIRNEFQLNQAKNRIWDAIEKPKRGKVNQWGLVSAIAASLSLFIISTLLYLKLDDKQQELDALNLMVVNKTESRENQQEVYTLERGKEETEEILEKAEMIAETEIKKAIKLGQESVQTSVEQKRLANETEPVSVPEFKELILLTEIDLPELDKPEPTLALNTKVEETLKPQQKPKGKLKLRIGNGGGNYDHTNSMAFNIKLKN